MAEQPQLSLSLLGSPRIALVQQGELALTNRKALALLAYLAVESDQAHSRETLLGLLWPDLPDADARNNLRVIWSQLRSKIGDDFLLGNRLEMQFNQHSAHKLDVAEFEALLAACAQHTHSRRGDCAGCQERLAQAVALYRGDFLSGLFLDHCAEFDEWLMVHRERFRQKMLEVLSELSHFHAHANNLAAAEGFTRHLLQLDPLREDAHRHLMHLLNRQRQPAAALAQFETCKRVLADGLGVQPDPETLALAAHIRSGSTPSSQTGKHNLPAPLTRFIGREKDIATLAAQLMDAHARVITLTGSGGVGKTRLALRAAYGVTHAFADGVWLVELAALQDALAVTRAVAAALGVREQAGMTPLQLLSDVLRDKQILLVMDNCEHVLSESSVLVAQLLAVAPKLTVLATSRTPLHVEGERVVRVPSLSVPKLDHKLPLSVEALLSYESVQLFVNRASAAHANFGLQAANANAVADICHRLDGIPLALELAAARIKVMPVDALAQRLDSRFKLLTSNNAEALPRHRTLQALVGWSYDLLPKAEQALLRQLSVFAGGWTLEAAEAVCESGDMPVLDGLMNLVDHSLVIFGHDANQQRYMLLETIRQFASQQLQQAGEEHDVRAKHARYYAQLAAQAAARANSPTHQHALSQMELERANVFGALGWAIEYDPDLALSLEISLGGDLDFWEMRGHFEEGRYWQRRLLDATQAKPSAARAKVLLDAAWVERAKPDYAQALLYAQASQTISEDLGDAFGSLDARISVANIRAMQGELAECHVLMTGLLAEAERLGHSRGFSSALYGLALNHFDLHEYEPARKLFERCLSLYRERGDMLGQADALHHLAILMDAMGDSAGSIPLYEEMETTYRELGFLRSVALVQNNLGCALMNLGQYERARRLFIEGLLIRREMGLQLGYVYSFYNFGLLAAYQNKPARAAQMLGVSEALRERIGFPKDTFDRDTDYLNAIASARAALGETRFGLEWSRGRGMSVAQAIEVALGENSSSA
jgi:predicted ATPase